MRSEGLLVLLATLAACVGRGDDLAACRAAALGYQIEADRARQSLRHVEARANAWLTFVSIVEAIDRHDATSLTRHGRRFQTLGLEHFEIAAMTRVLEWGNAIAEGELAKKMPDDDGAACLSWMAREMTTWLE